MHVVVEFELGWGGGGGARHADGVRVGWLAVLRAAAWWVKLFAAGNPRLLPAMRRARQRARGSGNARRAESFRSAAGRRAERAVGRWAGGPERAARGMSRRATRRRCRERLPAPESPGCASRSHAPPCPAGASRAASGEYEAQRRHQPTARTTGHPACRMPQQLRRRHAGGTTLGPTRSTAEEPSPAGAAWRERWRERPPPDDRSSI